MNISTMAMDVVGVLNTIASSRKTDEHNDVPSNSERKEQRLAKAPPNKLPVK
ncbi:hypothetical protein D3C75_1344060 [compost metagenome]